MKDHRTDSRIPAWHCCLFSLSCWKDWMEFGMPMRLYWHKAGKFWDIPFLKAKCRRKKIWEDATPVEVYYEER